MTTKPRYGIVLNTNAILKNEETILQEALDHIKKELKYDYSIIVEDSNWSTKYIKCKDTPPCVSIYHSSMFKKPTLIYIIHITLIPDIKEFKLIFKSDIISSISRNFMKNRKESEDFCVNPFTRLILTSNDPVRMTNSQKPAGDIVDIQSDNHENEKVGDLGNVNDQSMFNILLGFWFHLHWYINSIIFFTGNWIKTPKRDLRIVITTPDYNGDDTFDCNIFSMIYWNYQKIKRGITKNTKYASFNTMVKFDRKKNNQYVKTSIDDLRVFNTKERVFGFTFSVIYSSLRSYFYLQLLNVLLLFSLKTPFILLRHYYIELIFFWFDFYLANKIINGRLHVSNISSFENFHEKGFFSRQMIRISHFFNVMILLIGTSLISIYPAWKFF